MYHFCAQAEDVIYLMYRSMAESILAQEDNMRTLTALSTNIVLVLALLLPPSLAAPVAPPQVILAGGTVIYVDRDATGANTGAS
jgi:hypothetical protein